MATRCFVARFLLKHSKETSCLRRTKAGRVQNGTREELAWYYEKRGCVQKGVFFIFLEFRDALGDLRVPVFPERRHPIWTLVICAYSARTWNVLWWPQGSRGPFPGCGASLPRANPHMFIFLFFGGQKPMLKIQWLCDFNGESKEIKNNSYKIKKNPIEHHRNSMEISEEIDRKS